MSHRRGLVLSVLFVATLAVCVAAMTARPPSRTRTIPVNSTTAVSMSFSDTVASEAAGASTSDPNTFTLGTAGAAAYSVDDALNELAVRFDGSGSCGANDGLVSLITDHAGSTDVLTIVPAADANVPIDPNCTYNIGPAFPPQCRNFCIGNCAGTCYISFDEGGTGRTGRMTLGGGEWYCVPQPSGFGYVEVLSASATDTVQTVCQ